MLGVDQVDYLGHNISSTGIQPLKAKVAAILEFERPVMAKGLQTYLGMVNFYRRFLQGAAKVLRPLTEALKGGAKGTLLWTPEIAAAFKASKAAMVNAAELVHPVEGAELSLALDASATHVGDKVQQRTGDGSVSGHRR